ncbi:MAG: FHA domain-containing protein [Deltaproteobacteria bacterium]|nr:MAG: FHA domain-containing protein [Deltaproteobacteria bacterium]
MLELVIQKSGRDIVAFPLAGDQVRIGRAETNDISLPDPAVSRHQCLLVAKDGKLLLEDKSGRGTCVGGKPRRKAVLGHGDEIVFGDLVAMIREATEVSAPPTTIASGDTMVLSASAEPEQRLVITGNCGKRRIRTQLVGRVLTVGSDPANDIVLDDRFVSAFHCRLYRRNGSWYVADTDSTNGTRVNGVAVGEARLEPGATIAVGRVNLHVDTLSEEKKPDHFHGLVSSDPAMRPVFELIKRAAPSEETILITGESGTGKEMVARACHALSGRSHKPLVALNCAAISKDLMESELFGHEKGAFTGAQNARAGLMEEAHEGTLFLDEIGELALDLQAKLLRAVESGEIRRVGSNKTIQVDTRILAATHRSLADRVREGEFREDLYYRICVIEIHIPPLRKRPKDIPLLADFFLEQLTAQTGRKKFGEEAMEQLQKYRWPGNVRELKHVVSRAAIMSDKPVIGPEHLTFAPPTLADKVAESRIYRKGMSLREVEIETIKQALAMHDGNQRAAAKALGLARSTLVQKLERYQINPKDFIP